MSEIQDNLLSTGGLFAVLAVGILATGAIVMDSSRGYSGHRILKSGVAVLIAAAAFLLMGIWVR